MSFVPGLVTFRDGPQLGPFGWLRTAHPAYVFDAQLTYDLQPLLFEQVASGSGATVTHDATNRAGLMTFASTPTGGKAYMVSYDHHRYQPGRGQTAFITFNFNGGVADVLKFAGYSFGATNGIELQMNGTTARLALYSDTTLGDQFVNQADWDDPMDGTGASGITVDWTKVQILAIDLQALYVGRARVALDIDGMLVVVHEFKHANRVEYAYVQTANLPIRCGMTCTGTVSTTMRFYCSSVLSEGGQEDVGGYHFTAEGTATAGNGAQTHVLSLRPRTTFNSIANRSKFVLESLEFMVTGNSPVKWELCLGQAISGTTTFNNVNAAYSAMEFNTAGTISGSPTIVTDTFYTSATATSKGSDSIQVALKYPITLDEAGAVRALGTMSVLATGLGGSSACRCAANWREIR